MAASAFRSYLELVPKLSSGATSSISSQLATVDADKSGRAIGGKLGSGISAGFSAVGKAVAAAGIGAALASLGDAALSAYSDFEQLSGGAAKIFDEIDQASVLADASGAWETLNMSANQYLEAINDVGATFASTMGDAAGYETARTGLQAISDYATGTGKDIDLLTEKYTLITRATSSYQSIADQFSGILPQTSADFLEQAQAAGFLADSYSSLTEVPVAEYQQAVTQMLEKGVADLGLAGNTAAETAGTLSGSLNAVTAQWQNWLAVIGSDSADVTAMTGQLVDSAVIAAQNIIPRLSQILEGAATALATGIPQLLPQVTAAIIELAPSLIESAMQLVVGIVQALPTIIEQLTAALPQIVESLSATLIENMPTLISGAITLFGALLEALIEVAPQILAMIPEIIASLGEEIISHRGEIAEAGLNMIQGLGEGIANATDWVIQKIRELCSNALEAVKSFFGIESPSKVMRQQGSFLMQGFALGIEDSATLAERAMDSALSGIGGVSVTANAGAASAGGSTTNIYVNGARINDDAAMEDACYAFMMQLRHAATMQGAM